jgi:hypothetical protein
MDNVIAYYIATRRQLGTSKAMQHTTQRFGVSVAAVRDELTTRGLLYAQHVTREQEFAAIALGDSE